MTYTFTIEGVFHGKNRTFPSLNEYLSACGKNPKAGGRLKKEFGDIASAYIRRDLGRLKISKKIDIHYRFFESDKKRDKMNVFSFADKVIEDSLQECGVIPNDGWANIGDVTSEFAVSDNPRIEVTLTEWEN